MAAEQYVYLCVAMLTQNIPRGLGDGVVPDAGHAPSDGGSLHPSDVDGLSERGGH